jgi:hypothetical protein
MRHVVHNEAVRPVPETSDEVHLGAAPMTRLSGDAEMKESAGVGPCIRGIVIIIRAAGAVGSFTDVPFVSAEQERLARTTGYLGTFYGGDCQHSASLPRERIHSQWRTITGAYQKGSIG